MTYNEVIALAKKQGFDRKNLSSATGLTEDGLTKAIKNQTMQAKHVIKLCNFLHISPNELFDFVPGSENNVTISQNGGVGNQQTNITSSITALEKQLDTKDNQIKELLEIIKNK